MDWLRALPSFADVSVVVVVDGGGTRSRAAVAAPDGTLLGYAEGGPTNQRSVGDDEAAGNVRDVIRAALDQAAGGQAATAVLVSSASVDTQAHADVLARGVREAVGADATIAIAADTLGCWAATAKLAPAVAVIAGTGSSVLAASLDEGSKRYGGWDYVLGDEGSGFALGRAALREALFVQEGSSEAKRLASVVEARLGIVETDELFDAVYKPEVDKARIASFAGDVFTLAEDGDADCIRLIEHEAALLADTVAAAFRDFRELGTLGCFGGIWNSEIYERAFRAALAERVASVPQVVQPGDTAMVGSFRLVLRHHPEGEAGSSEDAAVERFATALAAAKDAAKQGGDA